MKEVLGARLRDGAPAVDHIVLRARVIARVRRVRLSSRTSFLSSRVRRSSFKKEVPDFRVDLDEEIRLIVLSGMILIV
eukprot:12356864-Heterocapsa_arctica.AAC.1